MLCKLQPKSDFLSGIRVKILRTVNFFLVQSRGCTFQMSQRASAPESWLVPWCFQAQCLTIIKAPLCCFVRSLVSLALSPVSPDGTISPWCPRSSAHAGISLHGCLYLVSGTWWLSAPVSPASGSIGAGDRSELLPTTSHTRLLQTQER